MSRYDRPAFNPSDKFEARRKFVFNGKTYATGDDFPWRHLACSPRKLRDMYNGNFITVHVKPKKKLDYGKPAAKRNEKPAKKAEPKKAEEPEAKKVEEKAEEPTKSAAEVFTPEEFKAAKPVDKDALDKIENEDIEAFVNDQK